MKFCGKIEENCQTVLWCNVWTSNKPPWCNHSSVCSLCLLACRPEGHNFPWLTELCSNMKYMDIFNITHQYFVGLMITQFHCNLKCKYIFLMLRGGTETNQNSIQFHKIYTPNQKTATVSTRYCHVMVYTLYFKYFVFLYCYLKKWSGLVHMT